MFLWDLHYSSSVSVVYSMLLKFDCYSLGCRNVSNACMSDSEVKHSYVNLHFSELLFKLVFLYLQ